MGVQEKDITDQRELRNMVEEMLLEEDGKFTEWEVEFLDKMYDQDGSFEDGQITKINEMYDERMR